MNEKEKHEYFGFDRYLQVVNTKYEKDFLELEEKYKNKEIDIKEYNKLWNEIINKILKEQEISK